MTLRQTIGILNSIDTHIINSLEIYVRTEIKMIEVSTHIIPNVWLSFETYY